MAPFPPVHVIQGSLPFTTQVMMKLSPEQFALTLGHGTVPGART